MSGPATGSAEARRAAVLARVRRALGRGDGADAVGARAAADRMDRPRANLVPLRGRLQQPQLGALFDEMVIASGASIAHVPDETAVPRAVADWCAERGMPAEAVLATASPLAELAWDDAGVRVERRLARSGDPLAVSTAGAGIAETGTLAVLSGPANPATANFLPEAHVVLVRRADLVGTPEDFWARLRDSGTALPRTVQWITGPSRTGDIEMVMTHGAHGPVHLHVIVVDG